MNLESRFLKWESSHLYRRCGTSSRRPVPEPIFAKSPKDADVPSFPLLALRCQHIWWPVGIKTATILWTFGLFLLSSVVNEDTDKRKEGTRTVDPRQVVWFSPLCTYPNSKSCLHCPSKQLRGVCQGCNPDWSPCVVAMWTLFNTREHTALVRTFSWPVPLSLHYQCYFAYHLSVLSLLVPLASPSMKPRQSKCAE